MINYVEGFIEGKDTICNVYLTKRKGSSKIIKEFTSLGCSYKRIPKKYLKGNGNFGLKFIKPKEEEK